MNKDRLGAFMDAVIAIIMTILVLELEKPSEPTLEAFCNLKINFATYALSFLWLAAMWMSIHNAWHEVEQISNRTIWLGMGLLFFASLFPYATSLVATYFTVNGFLAVDVLIKVLCAVLGVLFWPPLVSIGVLAAAVFIMVVRKKA